MPNLIQMATAKAFEPPRVIVRDYLGGVVDVIDQWKDWAITLWVLLWVSLAAILLPTYMMLVRLAFSRLGYALAFLGLLWVSGDCVRTDEYLLASWFASVSIFNLNQFVEAQAIRESLLRDCQ